MKVTILYKYFQDRQAPGHSLIFDLSQYLATRGHQVTVVAGETGYMKQTTQPLPWYRRLIQREKLGQVTVVRTYTFSSIHRSYLSRLFSFISFTLTAPLALLAAGKAHVMLISSPPLFSCMSGWLICKLRKIPYVLEVRDLWPDSAVQMGIVKNNWLIWLMKQMERLLYSDAQKIICLTEGIKTDISSRGWPETKLEVVTCGVELDRLYYDEEARTRIRETQGWSNKKVVMYFGAMGEANNLSLVVKAANELKENKDIFFVLIGDGMKRKDLERQIAKDELENIQILPPVPKEEAKNYLSASDLCLVTLLDIPLFQGAIPTKLIDYLACSRPVLCGVRGEAVRILEDSQGGLCFEPSSSQDLCDKITSLISNPALMQSMGTMGRAYVEEKFSSQKIKGRVEQILVRSGEGR